ncbi:MAG: hypothetical protein HYV09_34265 [Deltaproteobacteria bacterium]|nr:hypothetical protein [Deltaproteobacteria bacterium]
MKPIPTRVAALGYPEHRFQGHAVFGELVGSTSYAALIALAVSGRRPTAQESELLDLLAAATTVADPRIWPLKLARVVASYGSFLAGFSASQMALEGDRIGPPITVHAAGLLVELRDTGAAVDDHEACVAAARELIARRRRLVGFGIPFRPQDERYVVLREQLAARGRTALPYWRLQEALAEVVLAARGLPPNIGIGTAAMLLDMGYSPVESAAIVHFVNQHVFVANAFEGAEQARPELRDLPAEAVSYEGPAPRRTPRATGG